MIEHRGWRELTDERLNSDPRFRLAYEAAKRELDEAWEVRCPYNNCTWFVSPDSNVREDRGGWGPIDCPCKANEDGYCVDD